MRLFRIAFLVAILTLLIAAWVLPFAQPANPVYAQAGSILTPTPTPKAPRTTTVNMPFTSYRWWLIRYSNNQIACSFKIEHEGLPTLEDVQAQCEDKTYREWTQTVPCNMAEVKTLNECPGFYLQQVNQEEGERPVEVELPRPEAWISVANCNPQPPDNRCTTLPYLLFTAQEPLPNETIINIQGSVNGEPFNCMGATCSVPLTPTGMDGTTVTFWADSSFGDSTDHYTARVRVIPWGDFMNPEQTSNDPRKWYVDVLSSQWRDGKPLTCSESWQVFPPLGGLPNWLTSPDSQQGLESDVSYYYLAGSLITYGVVDASGCADGGLQAPNIASSCGVEAARPQLVEWQNRFDQEILQTAQDTGVPARLLKNVFARESQIWPGIYKTYKEAGLGQLTENGADTVLFWNSNFFHQFCPLVLDKKFCGGNFWDLGESEQNMLRGALVRKVNASCPDCPAGIDLSQANYSVRVFAEGMLANCEQVGQTIYNMTGEMAGKVSSYDDLWRFTLVNYNAGSGCLQSAVRLAWTQRQTVDWQTVSSYLDPVCQAAVGYVEDITRVLKATPTPTPVVPADTSLTPQEPPRVLDTPTPTLQPFMNTATPTPTATVTATATRANTFTPSPTATITLTLENPPTDTPVPTITLTPTALNQ